MKILMIITNGFEEVEFAGTLGILRRSGLDVDVYSLHNTSATGRYNLTVSNLKNITDLDVNQYDCLVIPGGPQYQELEHTPLFINTIKHFYLNNKLIAAICAGPTILGHLGILENRKYTCFSSMNEDFKGTYIDDYVVYDKNIITSKSAASTIDFAFKIVEVIKGKEYAEKVKNSIYYYSKN